MVCSSARREIYLHIDKWIIFLSTSAALNILSFYQSFRDVQNFMSLFGPFRVWRPTRFAELICPKRPRDYSKKNFWSSKNREFEDSTAFTFKGQLRDLSGVHTWEKYLNIHDVDHLIHFSVTLTLRPKLR